MKMTKGLFQVSALWGEIVMCSKNNGRNKKRLCMGKKRKGKIVEFGITQFLVDLIRSKWLVARHSPCIEMKMWRFRKGLLQVLMLTAALWNPMYLPKSTFYDTIPSLCYAKFSNADHAELSERFLAARLILGCLVLPQKSLDYQND